MPPAGEAGLDSVRNQRGVSNCRLRANLQEARDKANFLRPQRPRGRPDAPPKCAPTSETFAAGTEGPTGMQSPVALPSLASVNTDGCNTRRRNSEEENPRNTTSCETASNIVPSAAHELKCKDYRGRWHSVKELRERRNAAVLKGMQWLHKYLTADRCNALVGIGDDAACIFFEIWYTSSSSVIRAAARGIAQDLLKKYEQHLIQPERCHCKQCHAKTRQKLDAKDLFMQLMYLVRCKEEMDLDVEHMVQVADKLWSENAFDDTDKLFGVSPCNFSSVSDADWVVLIMNIMVMEFNQLLFRRRWPIKWGILEAFAFLRRHRYTAPPYDDECKFHYSFYLVTHIAFAASAYSAIKLNPRDIPWLFKYNRQSCLYWVKMAEKRQAEKPPDLMVDIDGLAEAVDVMRGTGLTDGGDPLLCSAALALLTLQRPDGSWPYWRVDTEHRGANSELLAVEPPNAAFYEKVHPTWVAVQSLRDRNFEYDRKGNAQWAEFMEKVLRQSGLSKLETRITYEKRHRQTTKCTKNTCSSRIHPEVLEQASAGTP